MTKTLLILIKQRFLFMSIGCITCNPLAHSQKQKRAFAS